MNNFTNESYEAFYKAAAEKYDFATCQRADGSYYGTGGTCRKGSPVNGVPEKEKKGKAASGGGGGGGGKAEQMRQINAQEGRGGGVGKEGRSPVGKKGIISDKEKAAMSKGGGAPSSKEVKALDKVAKAADKKAEAADKAWRKGGMKDKALQKEVLQLDRTAKAANKEAEKADKKFQAAQKRANTKKRQQAFEKELDKRKAKMKGASAKEQSRLISEASKAATDSLS